MKIVGKDNYNREWVSDCLVAENVNPYLGKRIIDYLNLSDRNTFYELVEDDYKLFGASTLY